MRAELEAEIHCDLSYMQRSGWLKEHRVKQGVVPFVWCRCNCIPKNEKQNIRATGQQPLKN